MQSVASFVLVEVDAGGKETEVSEHPNFGSGWSAGQAAVHADREGAYSLNIRGGRRVARFCHNRVAIKTASVEQAISLLA